VGERKRCGEGERKEGKKKEGRQKREESREEGNDNAMQCERNEGTDGGTKGRRWVLVVCGRDVVSTFVRL
jgi:hypothetical protein